ncbi:MAG TPA: VIT1/CCC1 transporter family protein [Burkholderiales bacterium]|nr:VIT1/CCC1 transporter family protein [Burkholderiales bacterium]
MDAKQSLSGELTSAYLYRIIAAREADARRKHLFEELARDAEAQAGHWRETLVARGVALPPFRPASRARLVGWLVERLGPRRLTQVLTAMKVRGMSVYREGARAPRGLGGLPSEHDEIGERHGTVGEGGSLRAAVFGVNDGLVSNAGLILGVAGAGASSGTILLAGVAGLLAGAFSMAAGEYVSMRSQREMYEYQIALEKAELDAYPEEEAEELALIYEARGVPLEEARRHAAQLIADPVNALDTLTREELGLNPDDLGSPWGAALASFAAFAVGSTVPLLPFVFAPEPYTLAASIAAAAAGLFLAGAATSLFTGRAALFGGARMLGIGAAAGVITYSIGALLGAGLA